MKNYRLDDIDINEFAHEWLERLNGDDASMRGLMENARSGSELGPAFMMANIAPQVVSLEASAEELVLFAVLAAFQNARFPGRPRGSWENPAAHLDAAFAYANELGRSGVAKNLLSEVVRHGQDSDGVSDRLTASSLGNDVGRIAAHEQEMAHLLNREIRAAALLDPSLSIETILLDPDSSP